MEEIKTQKYAHRSVDERCKEIDDRIAFHRKSIINLEKKKKVLLAPPKPRDKKTSMTAVIAELKKTGLTPEEIMKKLGLKIQ